MIVSQEFIRAGERIPFGYGLAWRDYSRDVGIFYLMPFNWIARALRWAFWKMQRPSPQFWEKQASGAWPKEQDALDALADDLRQIFPAESIKQGLVKKEELWEFDRTDMAILATYRWLKSECEETK